MNFHSRLPLIHDCLSFTTASRLGEEFFLPNYFLIKNYGQRSQDTCPWTLTFSHQRSLKPGHGTLTVYLISRPERGGPLMGKAFQHHAAFQHYATFQPYAAFQHQRKRDSCTEQRPKRAYFYGRLTLLRKQIVTFNDHSLQDHQSFFKGERVMSICIPWNTTVLRFPDRVSLHPCSLHPSIFPVVNIHDGELQSRGRDSGAIQRRVGRRPGKDPSTSSAQHNPTTASTAATAATPSAVNQFAATAATAPTTTTTTTTTTEFEQ